MAMQLTELQGELAAAPAVADKAARTGVWAIRPDQALHWASVTPLPHPQPLPPSVDTSSAAMRAMGVVVMVLVAGLLGAIGAWALTH